jgi:hypothetical protein
MEPSLNVGNGRCLGTARLLVKATRTALELGALQDVVVTALNAAHHANRTGSRDDFIAVALPTMRRGREGMMTGSEIELVGSEASLARYLALDGVQTLLRRKMVESLDISEIFVEIGDMCAAYVRDRSAEKSTPGAIRRAQARAARRGKLCKFRQPAAQDSDVVPLYYGDAVVTVREIVAPLTDQPLFVSTYGFSQPGSPAVLPVRPESAVTSERAHAA